jgi:hypothetical protein
MPKLTATVTTKQVVTIAPKLQRRLLTELQGYAVIAGEIKVLKGAKEDHSAKVLALSLEGVDGDKFELDGFKVAVMKGVPDRRLDKDALIKRLVKDGTYSVKAAQALLNDCTTEKAKKDFVKITVPGEKDDD